VAAPPQRPSIAAFAYRRAGADDLVACAGIWRDSINDYTRRLNQPDIPEDLGSVIRLYGHLRATDPDGFVVAEQAGADGAPPSVVAFAASVRREALWFLSMLFVLPDVQAGGLGRALLAEIMPPAGDSIIATCTDSAQPISNALYASLGMAPRMPLVRLVGLPERDGHLPGLPPGVRAVRFDELDGAAATHLDDEITALDRAAAGFQHLQDHAYVRTEGRVGILYVDGAGRAVGYGYTSEAGRVGPIAVRDQKLLTPVIGHLVSAVAPRGAFGIWMPGEAGEAMTALLRAGFRVEGFPCLVCWDRPIADFSRYVPISPGLL
jgi:GNAT superfamily N-acetyltransferase